MAAAVRTNRSVDSQRPKGINRPTGNARRPNIRPNTREGIPSSAALLARSERYGPGAIARRTGVVPVPGRTGLLAKIQNALTPSEVQSRLFSVLKAGRIPSLVAFSAAIPDTLMRVVIRAYGQSIATYFVNNKGAVPARSAASGVTASSVDMAIAGDRHTADSARSRAAEISDISAYRNMDPHILSPAQSPKVGLTANKLDEEDPYSASEKRQIALGLRDNGNWTELMQWFGAHTANIRPHLRVLQENMAGRGYKHSWSVTDSAGQSRSVSMDSGLHLIVASGYASDGSKTKGGVGSRTTFMGRRVDVLSSNVSTSRERLEKLSGDWGAVLAADYGVPPGSGRAALEEAISKRMCPVYISKEGRPMARLVYDPTMRAGTNVILAAVRLGFRNMSLEKDGRPSPMHPDKLETTFTEGYFRREVKQPGAKILAEIALRNGIGVMKAAEAVQTGKAEKLGLLPEDVRVAKTYVEAARAEASYEVYTNEIAARSKPNASRTRPSQPATLNIQQQLDAFGIDFGKTCTEVNPSNTAIVFHNARSSHISLVNRATGEELSGTPAKLGVSNLPVGNYLRLNKDELTAWITQGVDVAKRMSLIDAAGGRMATVSKGGVLSHYDEQGRLHNPLPGPSVVQALRDGNNREDTPTEISWHHEGVPMPKADFHALRARLQSEANVEEPELAVPELNNPFEIPVEMKAAKHG